MDKKNFTIGVLSTTAVIMLVGLIVIQTRPAPVLASGMTSAGRDYILTVGSVQTSARSIEEVLYVIDAAQMRLAVYDFDPVRKQIELIQGIELTEMRKAAEGAGQSAPKSKPRRRGGGRRP